MKVIAFVGPSGSGKSYRAMSVAQENDVQYIIDDGLFIRRNRIIAGFSAKREKTKLAAVRRALFLDSNHAQQVREAIQSEKPAAIMILGTSMGMIQAIVKVLQLPEISKVIKIEDVAEATEIEKAQQLRNTEGMHVIPVPTFEIKKDFSGYFIDSLQIFSKKSKGRPSLISNKSVVRPTYSYRGKYTISNQVIYTICEYEISKISDITKFHKVKLENLSQGLILNVQVSMKYGVDLRKVTKIAQKKVIAAIEEYTAMNVLKVNFFIKSLTLE